MTSSLIHHPRKNLHTLFYTILLLFLLLQSTSSLEAKWTPSSEDDGPLPLSQSQRNQLLQLEQTILSSPDPEATLKQIAESNNMPTEELASILSRNRRDLEMGLGGGSGNAMSFNVVQKIKHLILALLSIVMKYAMANPKRFGVLIMAWICVFYVIVMAPRTGVVLSRHPSLVSRGHSTFFDPPQEYVDGYLSSPRFRKLDYSFQKRNFASSKLQQHICSMEEDNVTLEKVGRKSSNEYLKNLSFFITSRKTISLEPFLEDEEEDPTKSIQDATELIYSSASTILSSRRFTEFTTGTYPLRFRSSNNNKSSTAAVVMKKMGDWNRFGIQPLKLLEEEEERTQNNSYMALEYGSLKGGHWDGILRFSIDKKVKTDGVVISVSLIIPKKGRKINKRLAEQLVTSLTQSISISTMNEAKKTLARKTQSSAYKKKFHGVAAERRHEREEHDRLVEEMANDRKRRWLRNQNPDAGRYRPSGERMKSPKNC